MKSKPENNIRKRIRAILPVDTTDNSLFSGYEGFRRFITHKVFERLLWSLAMPESADVDKSIKMAGALADRLRKNWTAFDTAEAESTLTSLPTWAIELFQHSFVGRHTAFLGAKQGDEVSFVVLLLHSIFTLEALKEVCAEQPDLARKYASRMTVWPWFFSSISAYQKDLEDKLKKVGFSKEVVKKHKRGTTVVQPAALEVMSTLLWLRLKAEEGGDAGSGDLGLFEILRSMPDLAGKKEGEITKIIEEAVINILSEQFGEKLHLNKAYSQRFPAFNKREIRRLVRQTIGLMLRPSRTETNRPTRNST